MSVSRETLAAEAGVSRETVERLDILAALLVRWNTRINLVSPATLPTLWGRHFADSLQLIPLLGSATEITDIGSGAGFPGLVLAIATGRRFTLVESDQRKCAYLREAIRLTGAPAQVCGARAEKALLPPAACITARAVAPLSRLLELCVPMLAPHGVLLFLKGSAVDLEIVEARLRWTMRIERHISRTGEGGVILRISEVQRA